MVRDLFLLYLLLHLTIKSVFKPYKIKGKTILCQREDWRENCIYDTVRTAADRQRDNCLYDRRNHGLLLSLTVVKVFPLVQGYDFIPLVNKQALRFDFSPHRSHPPFARKRQRESMLSYLRTAPRQLWGYQSLVWYVLRVHAGRSGSLWHVCERRSNLICDGWLQYHLPVWKWRLGIHVGPTLQTVQATVH